MYQPVAVRAIRRPTYGLKSKRWCGVEKAKKLKGTYWAKQDAGTWPPFPQGSEAQYDLFSA
jgi:hypothetical protein